MDEEFFIEESNPKKIFFVFCLLLIIGTAGYFGWQYYQKQDYVKLKTITVELGEKIPTEISRYLKSNELAGYILDVSNVRVDEEGNTNSVGEYSFKLTKGTKSYKGKIIVKDTKPPIVDLQNLTVGLNEEFDPEDFVLSCYDLSLPCYVSFTHISDGLLNEKEGTYDISLTIKDKYGNETIKKAKLTVKKGASLNSIKAADLEVDSLYPKDEDWDDIFTVRFSKGLLNDSPELDSKILAITNFDYSEKYKKEITNQTNILAYNKYGFVLGIIVKLEFIDGTKIYVPEEN